MILRRVPTIRLYGCLPFSHIISGSYRLFRILDHKQGVRHNEELVFSFIEDISVSISFLAISASFALSEMVERGLSGSEGVLTLIYSPNTSADGTNASGPSVFTVHASATSLLIFGRALIH